MEKCSLKSNYNRAEHLAEVAFWCIHLSIIISKDIPPKFTLINLNWWINLNVLENIKGMVQHIRKNTYLSLLRVSQGSRRSVTVGWLRGPSVHWSLWVMHNIHSCFFFVIIWMNKITYIQYLLQNSENILHYSKEMKLSRLHYKMLGGLC